MQDNKSMNGWDDLLGSLSDVGEELSILIDEQTTGIDDPIGLNILTDDIRFIDTDQQKLIEVENTTLKNKVLERSDGCETSQNEENNQMLNHSNTDVLLECQNKETKEDEINGI